VVLARRDKTLAWTGETPRGKPCYVTTRPQVAAKRLTNIVKSDLDWALFILTALTFALAVTRTVSLWLS